MKKSLKRIVSASLATMLMVGALTGCGPDGFCVRRPVCSRCCHYQ